MGVPLACFHVRPRIVLGRFLHLAVQCQLGMRRGKLQLPSWQRQAVLLSLSSEQQCRGLHLLLSPCWVSRARKGASSCQLTEAQRTSALESLTGIQQTSPQREGTPTEHAVHHPEYWVAAQCNLLPPCPLCYPWVAHSCHDAAVALKFRVPLLYFCRYHTHGSHNCTS